MEESKVIEVERRFDEIIKVSWFDKKSNNYLKEFERINILNRMTIRYLNNLNEGLIR